MTPLEFPQDVRVRVVAIREEIERMEHGPLVIGSYCDLADRERMTVLKFEEAGLVKAYMEWLRGNRG